MTTDAYAASVGVTSEVVRGWVQRGYVPTTKVGRHRLINVEAIRVKALRDGQTFLGTKEGKQ